MELAYSPAPASGCPENGWHKHQYCYCPKGEKIWKISSHHDMDTLDRKWNVACNPIVPEELRAEMESRGDNWMNQKTDKNIQA